MRIKWTKSCSLLRSFEPFLSGESSWFEYLLTFNKLSFIWHKVTKCEEPSKARTHSFGNCLLVCWAYFLNLPLRRGVLFWIFSDVKKEVAVISQREVTAIFSFLMSANMTNVFFFSAHNDVILYSFIHCLQNLCSMTDLKNLSEKYLFKFYY